MIIFIAGDDIRRRFQLLNFDGSGAPDLTVTDTTVSAGIFAKPKHPCDQSARVPLIPMTVQSASTPGAVWVTGIVAVLFPATLTIGLPFGEVLLEIQALLSGTTKCSAIVPVWIQKGL